MNKIIESMLAQLDQAQPVLETRERRYKGAQPMRFCADDLEGDYKTFSVNVYRLAVNAVAERMRVTSIDAHHNGADLSDQAMKLWLHSNLDQWLQAVLADTLALGSAYWVAWVDEHGNATMTAESAHTMTVRRNPVTGRVTEALKRWWEKDHNGVVLDEHIVVYEADKITHYTRAGNNTLDVVDTYDNPLDLVPVVPMVNFDRLDDTYGYSVIDDLADLVDALSKVVADMLVSSEEVARPKRYAISVDLEERDDDEYVADEDYDATAPPKNQALSPFADGSNMWVAENQNAKFGQLPGADLRGYQTSVDILTQQIMSVSALPAHMLGITTANPSSADAIRAAEASLTARAESRIRVLGIAVEQAVKLMLAIDQGVPVHQLDVSLNWASADTKSRAQEVDAITKLHSLGIVTTDEAREIVGVN